MKKVITRIVGSICILLAAVLMFFPGNIQLDGVSRRDLREVRNSVTDDIESTRDYFLKKYAESEYSANNNLKEELKDVGLPSTKTRLKTRFNKLGYLSKELFDQSISFKELTVYSLEAPELITDAEKLLESDLCVKLFIDSPAKINAKTIELLEDTVFEVSDYKYIFYGVPALFILLFILTVLAVISQSTNRIKPFKYVFTLLIIAITVALYLLIPLVSQYLPEALEFIKYKDITEATLKVTIVPILACVLSLVPVFLDIFAPEKQKKSKKKKANKIAENEKMPEMVS